MRVAVIGAGAAGVVSARHLTKPGSNHTCVVYEQTGSVGGTWVYTDRVGEDENCLPVHTSMYKSLRTNLPKEIMGFPDFPIPVHDKSYIPSAYILKLITDYTDHFNVKQYIKFHHQVRMIKPRNDGGWDITARDLNTRQDIISKFDAVMICNGHYWLGYVPPIEGRTVFAGEQMHSHDYRTPEKFQNKNVLVLGAGPSGMDLALEISSVARKVVLSHHSRDEIRTVFPDNLKQKPDVEKLTADSVHFVDGTTEIIDIILYCTGFLYSFPFLSDDCGITVQQNYVQPLYKQLISMKYPTMCFIGLPFYVCAFLLFDIQVQFFLRTLDGRVKLPSHELMLQEKQLEEAKRKERGYGPRQAHMLGTLQGDYFNDLCDTAAIRRPPPVMAALHEESTNRFLDDLVHYREDIFRIVDENIYELVDEKNKIQII